jgi:hypothetical protein
MVNMTSNTIVDHDLPAKIYRRFLMLTDFWAGSRAAPGSLLVKMHSSNDARPFFWVGTPKDLIGFYQHIGSDRSIYCFPGTYNVMPETQTTITHLANYHVAEILKVCPQGPFLLGGFCTASLITYETAKILTEKGHQIGLLALCETDVSEQNTCINLFRRMYFYNERLYHNWLGFKAHPHQMIQAILGKITKIKLNNKQQTTVQAIEPLYTLSGYTGKVDLIYVRWGMYGFFSLKYFQNYWKNLALQSATFHIVEGRIHEPPDWDSIAKTVKKLLPATV